MVLLGPIAKSGAGGVEGIVLVALDLLTLLGAQPPELDDLHGWI
jgi:hypothetical protein